MVLNPTLQYLTQAKGAQDCANDDSTHQGLAQGNNGLFILAPLNA